MPEVWPVVKVTGLERIGWLKLICQNSNTFGNVLLPYSLGNDTGADFIDGSVNASGACNVGSISNVRFLTPKVSLTIPKGLPFYIRYATGTSNLSYVELDSRTIRFGTFDGATFSPIWEYTVNGIKRYSRNNLPESEIGQVDGLPSDLNISNLQLYLEFNLRFHAFAGAGPIVGTRFYFRKNTDDTYILMPVRL